MNFATLKTLIESGDNAAKTDAQVTEWLNTPSIIRMKEFMLTVRTAMSELGPVMADTVLNKLEAVAAADSVVARTLAMMQPSEGGIDCGHAATRAQIDALQTAGVLNSTEASALKALGEETISPATNAGLGEITAPQVNYARTLA